MPFLLQCFLLLVIFLRSCRSETALRFLGQTHFVVNESSHTVVRLVVERVGQPVNITALLLMQGEDTGDFEATTAAVFLEETETNKTIFVAVRDDDLPEADEKFVFQLSFLDLSTSVTLGSPNSVTIIILSNDNAFGIISFNSTSLITVDEPKGKKHYVNLTLIRDKGTYGTVTAYFEILDGPNPSVEDLSPDRGNITMLPGHATVVYSILVQEDQIPEDDEIFTVQLTDVSGGALLKVNCSKVQIKINKNDSPICFAQAMMVVPESVGTLNITVVRGKNSDQQLIGSDDTEISIDYFVSTGSDTDSATILSDFSDLQKNKTLIFPPLVYEAQLHFMIHDDSYPEIAESFQVVLLEDTLKGDGVLLQPSLVHVIIEPNDKPYGVLSISSNLLFQTVVINEDTSLRFQGISVVRNGGTYSNVSVNWQITRNSSDPSPVSSDLGPTNGTLTFSAGQSSATVTLYIIDDDQPEEAEAFIFKLLSNTVRGGAELYGAIELMFYIQDSDDVYGLFCLHPSNEQSIQSLPSGRFLSLNFLRNGGSVGDVSLNFIVLYIPPGPVNSRRAKENIINGTNINGLFFLAKQSEAHVSMAIRNDVFLQNEAHFLVLLKTVDLVGITPPIPSISPRFGEIVNMTLTVTTDIANGEIGFSSNQTLLVFEPEEEHFTMITLPVQRDGTDGQAVVFWNMQTTGFNQADVTQSDLSPFSGSVTFLSGDKETFINIYIMSDNIPEVNETVIITLDRVETSRYIVYFGTNAENQVLKPGFTRREIVIFQNDNPGGIFEFSQQSRRHWFINEGEAVELRVVRSQGLLLNQLVRYDVVPNGKDEFYGAMGILEFNPGDREVVAALVARPDDIPELDEMFTVILSSYSTPPSMLGGAKEVSITIHRNDDPLGVFEFFSQNMAIKESKDNDSYSASYTMVRNRGTFQDVLIFWAVEPRYSADVHPSEGYVVFREGEVYKNLTLFSVPDEVPEDNEDVIISLINITVGARLGSNLNASLRILKNDDPIYFAEPVVITVKEGSVANFTVLRAGTADSVAMVMYQITNGGTSTEDFVLPKNDTRLIFEIGELSKEISVAIKDDYIPEEDEPFFINLRNPTGDVVVYDNERATVVIEANDDASGIFSVEQVVKALKEGESGNIYVLRDRGLFCNVTVLWQLFANDTILDPGQDFVNVSGSINFTTGEAKKPITLQSISDQIPEFNEYYIIRLVNISGGCPGDVGQLANVNLSASLLIVFNDDPFGVFAIDEKSIDLTVAEDVLSENDTYGFANFTVLRQQGTFGNVRVVWEILSSTFPLGLPQMDDLLLTGNFPNTVEHRPHLRRDHSATETLFFPGLPGAYSTIYPNSLLQQAQSPANFTFSAWLRPNYDTNGFVISKATENGTFYYGIKIYTNSTYITLMLCYNSAASNSKVVTSSAVKQKKTNIWFHVLITVENGIIEFHVDGTRFPGVTKNVTEEVIADGNVPIWIGSDPAGNERYTGLMQDVRMYSGKLNDVQIHELYYQPAGLDLHTITGYLEYHEGEHEKSFGVDVIDDREEESEEVFYMQLVSVRGGARLPEPKPTGILRILKSDNANGLFGFNGSCSPNATEEGSIISCVIERTRGAFDYVYVKYKVVQFSSSNSLHSGFGFATENGFISFKPGQRSEILYLLAVDDDIPEVAESYLVQLVSAESADGKHGSTPTSGASIDPKNAANTVTIKANDHPYGLLQFSSSKFTGGIIMLAKEAHVTVKEEDGEVQLLVIRTQGLLGTVMVGYRTVSDSAFSPKDFEETSGVLHFLPGEQHKYIRVSIVDNISPELEKMFRVELFNPEGGANLGIASEIRITIAASDDAHGVFQFDAYSLDVNGTEPEDGGNLVNMQVVRSSGALSEVVVFWEMDKDNEKDLVYRTGNVTFSVGQTRATIVLQVADDDIPEIDKIINIIISNVSDGRLGHLTTAKLNIFASDDPYGVFVFLEKNRVVKVKETDANVTLTIQRERGLMGSVKVYCRTLKNNDPAPFSLIGIGRATDGSDFIDLMSSVIFVANQREDTITLQVLDDEEPERAEVLFVEIFGIDLLQGVQQRPITNSPRLGQRSSTVAQVIIEASDDAFGVLQLSSKAVSVAEHYVGPIINVTRIGGIFGEVSIKFQALPMTATLGEDFSVASSDVVLLDGETTKPIPIYIINDNFPELEETFCVKLLNQTTGGAMLGVESQAIITILPSDDAFGAFGFKPETFTVQEPSEITLTIFRNGGTLGNVSLHWQATIDGKPAADDLRPFLGDITFVSGETTKTQKITVLADGIPEIEEVIHVGLINATNGGNIEFEKTAKIVIQPNDNPHGTISFEQTNYRVQEPLEGVFIVNIPIKRSGGTFGRLEILYRTSTNNISTALGNEENINIYFDLQASVSPSDTNLKPHNVTSQKNPLTSCATFCLQEETCQAFVFSNSSEHATCSWISTNTIHLTRSPQLNTYMKNTTATALLFSSHATAESDYVPIMGLVATMLDGARTANLAVNILSDMLTEKDESFLICILNVDLVNVSTLPKNKPTIGKPDTAVVTIAMNGDAFGVFALYISNPNASKNGSYLEVREEPSILVQLVVERRGGSAGQVTVEWNWSGTATPNDDFIGTGEVLVFADGDLKKTVNIVVLDDTEPEDSETLEIRLVRTEGGSRILPNSEAITIVILANDHVAGVIGFHSNLLQTVANQGEKLHLRVVRSAPGRGNVTVEWRIQGPRVSQTFYNTSGVLDLAEGILSETLELQLLKSETLEERAEFRVILSKTQTKGVPVTGQATLNLSAHEAVVFIEVRSLPIQILSLDPYSLKVFTEEKNTTIKVIINSENVASGMVNISYETVRGSLDHLHLTKGNLAEPGIDFLPFSGSLLHPSGYSFVAISVMVMDDDIPELEECFLVNITSADLISEFGRRTQIDTVGLVAEVCIGANDGVYGISDWQATEYEVNETIGVLTLVAVRNVGTHGNVSLSIYIPNMEAELGIDFNVTPRILTFADGEKHKFIDVNILDDDFPEGNEKFQLILSNASFGLMLGQKTAATVVILANDDGHGVISFNNSDHFVLQEPSSLSILENIATLYVVRNPAQGIFGAVSVQFHITDGNGSLSVGDLVPTEGFVVLEDGVRFKTLRIAAVLDEETEMNETFTVTLFNPKGGARLGDFLQTNVTIIQNQAPLGIFQIFPSYNQTRYMSVEEGDMTLFFTVSRSKGLETVVSVEWETQSYTAFSASGDLPVLAVYQSFHERTTIDWCSLPSDGSLLVLRLERLSGSSRQTMLTLYRWQGIFVPVKSIQVEDPMSCVGFAINGTSYVAVAHWSSSTSVSFYKLHHNMNLTLEQIIYVEGSVISYFSEENKHFLIISNQVLVWAGTTFITYQELDTSEIMSLSFFYRGSVLYLAVVSGKANGNCFLFHWNNGRFIDKMPLTTKSSVKQVEVLQIGINIYLLIVAEGQDPTCEVFVWGSQQTFFVRFQSIPFDGLVSVHSFTLPSGMTYLLLAGSNMSALFTWKSEASLFSKILHAQPAQKFLFLPMFQISKTLIASTRQSDSVIYELKSISNQSDFIYSSGRLYFEPGNNELTVVVNIIDDNIPEEEEYFTVVLKKAMGGAEISLQSDVTVTIPANDDAHGIIGFSQNSLHREAENFEVISLNVERLRGTFGKLTVNWTTNGSLNLISPASGVLTLGENQVLGALTFTILADHVLRKVIITLTHVMTVSHKDAWRGAIINPEKAQAVIIIHSKSTTYGFIEWDPNFHYVLTKEPQENPINLTLTILREQGATGDVAVHYKTVSIMQQMPATMASENEDYVPKSEKAVLMEGTQILHINITILPDDIPELAEKFLVNITFVELLGTYVGPGAPALKRQNMEIAEVTIEENDDPRGVFQFNVTKDSSGMVLAHEVPFPGNVLLLPVLRLAGTIGNVTLHWEAHPVSANFDDFTPASGYIIFKDGQKISNIAISVIDDSMEEYLETFNVTLVDVSGGARIGNEYTVVVSILPNDSPYGLFGFEENTVVIKEPQFVGDPDSVAKLTVVRTSGGHEEVHLRWQLDDSANGDLQPLNGSLHFNEMDSNKSIVLYALADNVLEGEENFTIRLVSDQSDRFIHPLKGLGTVVIQGDKGALGTVSIAESSHDILIGEPEGAYNGTALISLVRGPGIFGEILVFWNITPLMESEFVETAGVVTMRDRQSSATIRIQVKDDNIPEERRVYQLILTSVSSGAEIKPAGMRSNITVAASDYPYGLFFFSQEFIYTTEKASMINLTVVRSRGTFGSVLVYYEARSSTALSGLDFVPAVGELLFRPLTSLQTISLEILDDDYPEGPEVFYVNIISVRLLNDSNWDFRLREQGLQPDQPPSIGNVSFVLVVIEINDNVEGIVEFNNNFVNITVEEDVGTLLVPVLRLKGSYGQVTAEYTSNGQTALPDVDYFIPYHSVIFSEGQNISYINVSIIDDLDREYSEVFEIVLSGVTGGAVLGKYLVTRITIALSDSPTGVVRFVNQTVLTIENPNSILRLILLVERTGELVGQATVNWNILGPNTNETLPPVNTDFAEPVNGSLHYKNEEGGLGIIELYILPHTEVEVKETFIIRLSLFDGDIDIDPAASNVRLTIKNFGDPNGIVQFTPESLKEHTYSEPNDMEGPLNISFPVMRREGTVGYLIVFWEIQSISDTTGDFASLWGSINIPDGERFAEVVLCLLPDNVPELEEIYILTLSSVIGGAELDTNRSSSQFRVKANDDPYGVFALLPEFQKIAIDSVTQKRHIILNVTRYAGAFGNVTADYRITSSKVGQNTSMDPIIGTLSVKNGAHFASTTVLISSQEFFEVGFNFTAELINVHLDEPVFILSPQILPRAQRVIITVPEEMANSEVGFEYTILKISNFDTNHCEAWVLRIGQYGDVEVEWRVGYPAGQAPMGAQLGLITPASGSIKLKSNERTKAIFFTVKPNVSKIEVFAVHLTSARANVSGGAKLRGNTVAEIEPFGVFQFSPDSLQIVVEENMQNVTLYVQRLFGFHSSRIYLTYETWPNTAKAGEDFLPVQNGELMFSPSQTVGVIHVTVLNDDIPEPNEIFCLNLTGAHYVSGELFSVQSQPRLIPERSTAFITILANDMSISLLSIRPTLVHVAEDSNVIGQHQNVTLQVKRTTGTFGVVHVSVKAYGGKSVTAGLESVPFVPKENITWALEEEDFQLVSTRLSLQDGQYTAEVVLLIWDDLEPEGQEVFYIYLENTEGNAHIGSVDEQGFTSYSRILIKESDFQNGIVGFSLTSQSGLFLNEDSDNRTALLILQRQENRVFEDLIILWRMTFSTITPSLENHDKMINLKKEFLHTSGTVLFKKGETRSSFSIEIQPDKEPEDQYWFLVEIYHVGSGATINESARFANITVLESDGLQGLVYFAVESRLPVVTKQDDRLSLWLNRNGSTSLATTVHYQMEELQEAEAVGPNFIWPAVAGKDFEKKRGLLTFEQGQRRVALDIILIPEEASNLLPKRFQVVLLESTGGARVHPVFGVSNVTIVSDIKTQMFWALLAELQQPLDTNVIDHVLHSLNSKVTTDVTQEQLTAVLDALRKVLTEGEQTSLMESSQNMTYNILCSLANPKRLDTRGLSHLAEITERFAFSLLLDIGCGSPGQRGKTIWDTCPYISISAYYWYSNQINGHTFQGRSHDFFQLPEFLLRVPKQYPQRISTLGCHKVQFTEYNTEHWFLSKTNPMALNSKVFSVSLKDQDSNLLSNNNSIIYRIHSPVKLMKPGQSQCLLWSQTAASWVLDTHLCHVLDDSGSYVECTCNHFSIYTAFAETSHTSDYNEAFYTASFICISGFALAIFSNILFYRLMMFAAKLLIQMMVACLGAQICYIVSAFQSQRLSEESCSALGLVTHYFYLSQFSWMLIQASNFWQLLVLNNEQTERHYRILFLLSWGMPALIIVVIVTILLGGYGWNIASIYGLVYDVCFIPNVYLALCSAALLPLICLVSISAMFIHTYKVSQQWNTYDDIFRGRPNSTEVPMLLTVFALVFLNCLCGGLHMAYRHMWMLILYAIINSFLGLYVFIVYFVMHNQLWTPMKASYTVETNRHRTPNTTILSKSTPTVEKEMDKYTQNLITAMEEVSADWEKASLTFSSQNSGVIKIGPLNNATYSSHSDFYNINLVADEESQEFDDLIQALKAGSGHVSDNDSTHDSQDGVSVVNSQIVELRRIPIADTHL